MKGFITAIFILFLALAQAAIEEDHSNLFRITSGVKAKANSVPSYVALQIFFDRGTKTCGGFLGPAADQVVTAASCIFE
jgi:secreted trypsin-like serine protease